MCRCTISTEIHLVGYLTVLTSSHEKALTLLFAELEATATEQREAFWGRQGNLTPADERKRY